MSPDCFPDLRDKHWYGFVYTKPDNTRCILMWSDYQEACMNAMYLDVDEHQVQSVGVVYPNES